MIYIANAFSLQMVQDETTVVAHKATAAEVAEQVARLFPLGGKVEFCIGHRDTAAVALEQLSNELSKRPDGWFELTLDDVNRRVNIALNRGDVLYVLQVTGGRLPEGCTTLPEGINLMWRRVNIG